MPTRSAAAGPALLRLTKPPTTGPEVRRLQRRLAALGYDTGGVDGIFGSATDRCVKAFQKDRGLEVDGVVGPATAAALAARAKPARPGKPAKPTRPAKPTGPGAAPLDISDAGVRFIGAHEGFRATAYDDAAVPPNATIGYGHVLHRGPVTAADRKLTWTQKQALDSLRGDCAHAVEAVRTGVTAQLTQPQFDALCSFAFNVGGGAFAGSTLLERVNAGDLGAVPAELMKWVRAGSVTLPGLERRRAAEAALFTTERYDSDDTAPLPAGGRTLHLANPFLSGPDVLALQQLLAQNGFLPGAADGVFGPATAEAVRQAKWALGYPSTQVDGSSAALLVGYLGGKPAPPSFQQRAAKRKQEAKTGSGLRAAIVAIARWGIANEAQIHYSQEAHQRMAALGTPKALPLATDCSAWVTLCYRWAGGPDPNGLGFNGQGYTGTMLKACRQIAQSAAQPGDLVVWGPPPGNHVALVLEPGGDAVLCSHGQEKGPMEIAFSVETRYQPTPATWLTCLPR